MEQTSLAAEDRRAIARRQEPGPPTDLALARRGDSEAGRRLLEGHGPSMRRTAARVLGRYGAEVDDVVQEALIAALTTDALPRGDVGAWLRSITARKALDALRKHGRRGETPIEEGAELEASLPQQDEDARLAALTVRRLLAELQPVDRAVLELCSLEGLTAAEAAAALGLSRAAVKLRAMRARRRLARRLEEKR